MRCDMIVVLIAYSVGTAKSHLATLLTEDLEAHWPVYRMDVIAERFLDEGSNIVVSFGVIRKNSCVELLMRRLHSRITNSITTLRFTSGTAVHRETRTTAENFLLLMYNDEQPSEKIETLRHIYDWTAESKVVLIVIDPFESGSLTATSRDVMNKLQKINVLFLIVPEAKDAVNSTIILIMWSPHPNEQCSKVSTGFDVDIEHIMNFNLQIIRLNRLFNYCRIMASTFEDVPMVMAAAKVENNRTYFYDKGLEIQVMNAIRESSGYQLEYRAPPPLHPRFGRWGGRLDNGTWVGILGDVINGHADVAFCGFRATEDRVAFLDVTVGHSWNAWHWYIARPKPVWNWKSLIFPFRYKIWTLLTLSLPVFSITIYLVNRKTRRESGFCSPSIAFLSSWSVLIGIALHDLPRSSRLRLLFAVWLFYSLVINQSYQITLVSMLTSPGRKQTITTVEQLVKSKMRYGSIANIRRSFAENSDDPIASEIYANIEVCSSTRDCLKKVLTEDFAFYTTDMNIEYELHGYVDSKGKRIVYPLRNGGMSYDTVMFLKRSSPYLQRFNAVLRSLTEAGLVTKWWTDIIENKVKEEQIKKGSGQSRDFEPLNLNHLGALFVILSSGILISCVVIVGEVALEANGKLRSAHSPARAK